VALLTLDWFGGEFFEDCAEWPHSPLTGLEGSSLRTVLSGPTHP